MTRRDRWDVVRLLEVASHFFVFCMEPDVLIPGSLYRNMVFQDGFPCQVPCHGSMPIGGRGMYLGLVWLDLCCFVLVLPLDPQVPV